MTGCLYELNGEIKAYPNIERLKKKLPNAKIIKLVEDISMLPVELLNYQGVSIKEKPKQEGLRECPYQYRINRNTVLMAYTEEDLNKLKKWHNVL